MISIHAFEFNPFQENTYIISTPSGTCVIIDPGCSNAAEERELLAYIENNKLKVKDVLLTHCHIDHVLGLDFTARHFGLKPLIPEGEAVVLESNTRVAEMYGITFKGIPEVAFFEGDFYQLEDARLDILQVPGHSPAHVAFYHKASGQLISGDVLFYRSIGRTDLPGGHHATLLESIRKQLFTLPDETVVHPGHMQSTTIGDEKRLNPFF